MMEAPDLIELYDFLIEFVHVPPAVNQEAVLSYLIENPCFVVCFLRTLETHLKQGHFLYVQKMYIFQSKKHR